MGKTSKKDNMGCIGLGSGGYLCKSKIKIFTCEENDPSELLKEHRESFGGEKYLMKYILVDNPEKIKKMFFDKLEKKSITVYGDMAEITTTSASECLKEIVDSTSGEDSKVKFHYCGKKKSSESSKKKTTEESGDEKKKTKKVVKEKSSDEESEDEKPAKKQPSKPVKKPTKKVESSDSEEESDSD